MTVANTKDTLQFDPFAVKSFFFLAGLASVLSGGAREHFPMIRVKIFSKKNLTKTTQKVEDMATEFLLTFLAVLVQLGLPVRQQQGLPGKESESRFAIYRLAALSWVQQLGPKCWLC